MEIKLAQPLFLIIFGIFMYVGLRGKKRHSRIISRLGFILLVILFATTMIFPEITTAIANFLGIGRGADFVLYVTTMSLALFAVLVTKKMNEIHKDISEIVGFMAINDYHNKTKK